MTHTRRLVAVERQTKRKLRPEILRDQSSPCPTRPASEYRRAAKLAGINAQDAARRGAFSLSRSYAEFEATNRELAAAAEARHIPETPPAGLIEFRRRVGEARAAVHGARHADLFNKGGIVFERLGALESDRDVKSWANRRALEAAELVERIGVHGGDDMDKMAAALSHWKRWGLEPPKLIGARTIAGVLCRLVDPLQWRRIGRCEWAQTREAEALCAGRVHRRAGLYVSDSMLWHVRRRRDETRELLEAMIAEASDGERIDLITAVDASNANPRVRRQEMMARIAGLDELAECRGDAANFVTLTAASKYHRHRWRQRRVEDNPTWRGALPTDTQRRLAELWDEAVRRMRKKRLPWYGLRTVQPHHDGTPHWHVLMFSRPEHVELINQILREVFLQDDPDEPGAAERRVVPKLIDRRKGSAVGYVSRYIARAINGADLRALSELDDEGVRRKVAGDSITAVERVTAWASVWRIRMFQFVGTAPQTWAREFRRMKAAVPSQRYLSSEATEWPLEVCRVAADEGNYCEFTDLCGGPGVSKKQRPLKTWRQPGKRLNRYDEPRPDDVKGVQLNFDFYHQPPPLPPPFRVVERSGYVHRIQPRRRVRGELKQQRKDFRARWSELRNAWNAVAPRVLTRSREWTLHIVKGDEARQLSDAQRDRCEAAWSRHLGALSITVPATAGDAAIFQASPPPAVSDRRPPANSPARPPPS